MIPISEKPEYVRKVAVAVSRLICNREEPPEDVAEHARTAFSRWLEAGGVCKAACIPDKPGGSFDMRREVTELQRTAANIPGSAQAVNWQEVERCLADRGYRIRLRRRDSETTAPFIPSDDLLPIYDVVSPDDEVVAEGKGIDRDRAKRSALGEAVERLVGESAIENAHPPAAAFASPSELSKAGFSLPEIVSGPRDIYSSPELFTDWVRAETFAGGPAWIPAEAAFTAYEPHSGVSALNLCNTVGLAAGATLAEAFAGALLELLELDACSIAFRCRPGCPDVSAAQIESLDPRLSAAVERIKKSGISVHCKWISLDWPVPVALTVLVDERNRMPAFSKGSGAALTAGDALTESIVEAFQAHSDLSLVANVQWRELIQYERLSNDERLAWCDPSFRSYLTHLISEEAGPAPHAAATYQRSVASIAELCYALERRKHKVHWSRLGTLAGLHVVRVLVDGLVPPDPRLERVGPRLSEWCERERIPAPYACPLYN